MWRQDRGRQGRCERRPKAGRHPVACRGGRQGGHPLPCRLPGLPGQQTAVHPAHRTRVADHLFRELPGAPWGRCARRADDHPPSAVGPGPYRRDGHPGRRRRSYPPRRADRHRPRRRLAAGPIPHRHQEPRWGARAEGSACPSRGKRARETRAGAGSACPSWATTPRGFEGPTPGPGPERERQRCRPPGWGGRAPLCPAREQPNGRGPRAQPVAPRQARSWQAKRKSPRWRRQAPRGGPEVRPKSMRKPRVWTGREPGGYPPGARQRRCGRRSRRPQLRAAAPGRGWKT
jgi:hypothetical protein